MVKTKLVKYVTTLISASKQAEGSLKATVPKGLVDLFELKSGDKLEWNFDHTKGKLEATVKKLEE